MPSTLPVAVGADCRTTHYACRCVMEQLEKAEAEVERLKRLLEEARWYVSEYAYATFNPTARALMAEVDAALAERGEGV